MKRSNPSSSWGLPVRRAAGRACLAAVAATLTGSAALAQLVLPGAAPSTQRGSVTAPVSPNAAPSAPPAPRKPTAPKALPESSLDGKTLMLNGSRGRLTVEKRDKAALTVRLIVVGEKISKPGESCGVDLGAGQSIVMSASASRPQGVARYELGMQGCPVTFDVLDGGLYASGIGQACEISETDCRIDPRGVWGPAGTALDDQADAIEKDRARADKAVRETYKALIAKVPKTEKGGVRQIASEQAGFTSERELVCRDYAREAAHGFCSARYTELRAAALAARLNPAAAVSASSDTKPKPKPKPKPKMPIDPATGRPIAPVPQ
jgi:hypothetical protein